MANMAMVPAIPPTSSRTISARDLPSRLTDANRITKSCTAPPRIAPMRIHSVPGRYPNCAASTGPTSGPGPLIDAK